jgi:hypothetical protein
MNGMTPHSKPAPRFDRLLLVAFLILAGGMLEVWASWLYVASVSGFPRLGELTTGWILPVTAEAYWATALYAWLASPAGPRSRRFAIWSAGLMFALSLGGQESGHLMAFADRSSPPVGVVMLLTALPLISVALIAVLVELRRVDHAATARAESAAVEVSEMARLAAETAAWKTAWTQAVAGAEAGQDAARAEAEAAAAAEIAALAGELAALRDAVAVIGTERDAARDDAAKSAAKADQLARKLGAASGAKRTPKSAPNKTAGSPPKDPASSPPEAEVPDDVDTQVEALRILAVEPGISGSKLGLRLGKTERYGQILKKQLAASVAGPDAQAGERS